ncbi:MAG: RNA methyltransferase [Candidatus Micrarchaeota archaeon]|nr:RNA methyltransferase [Candidatus Micrarchaeota archaeon]
MEFTSSRKVRNPLPVRVVLVEPEHSMNLGMVARAVKNFGVVELALVNPQCKIDVEAVKYAKHSKEVLENAKIYKTLKDAVKGFDLVIGTTGVVRRFTSSLKNCVPLPVLQPLVSGKRVALVFGREGIGLNESELMQCDVVTHIPADKAHPVLNLSHSVAVVLYALYASRNEKPLFKTASVQNVEYLENMFSQVVDKLQSDTFPKLRNPTKAKIAFKHVLGRSNVADSEMQVLMGVFSRIRRQLYGVGNQRNK